MPWLRRLVNEKNWCLGSEDWSMRKTDALAQKIGQWEKLMPWLRRFLNFLGNVTAPETHRGTSILVKAVVACTVRQLLDFTKSIPPWQKQCCQMAEIIEQFVFVLSVTMKKNGASSRKVAEFWNFWLAVWCCFILVYFFWISWEASSGPGNTEWRKSNNKSSDYWLSIGFQKWYLTVHTNTGVVSLWFKFFI
jgi:hypothetical protein